MTSTTAQGVRQALEQQVPDSSRADRVRSTDPGDFPVPTGREEEWRFTPLDRVAALFEPVGEATGVRVETEIGDPVGAPPGVSSVPAPGVGVQVVEHDLAGTGVRPGDRAAAVALADATVRRTVRIPAEYSVPAPVTVSLAGTGGRGAVDLVVEAGAFSKATVVIDHTGEAVFGGTVGIRVGEGATLSVISLQSWDAGAVHLGQHDAVLAKDADFRHVAVTLGGGVVRLDTNVEYTGEGARAECLGLYFAGSGQHHEHRLFVDHSTPRCRSSVTYKGALEGETARTVWVGDVLIRAEAEGIDTYELNRNLVLSDGARADSVPNLEIETGQIAGAGHASATGRFDDEQLFYLQARGIRPEQARRLVVRGFFAEILQQIGIDTVEERLLGAIEDRLGGEPLPEETELSGAGS